MDSTNNKATFSNSFESKNSQFNSLFGQSIPKSTSRKQPRLLTTIDTSKTGTTPPFVVGLISSKGKKPRPPKTSSQKIKSLSTNAPFTTASVDLSYLNLPWKHLTDSLARYTTKRSAQITAATKVCPTCALLRQQPTFASALLGESLSVLNSEGYEFWSTQYAPQTLLKNIESTQAGAPLFLVQTLNYKPLNQAIC
jgi:hypothetical protein